jgi:hypothetical protein
VLWGQNRESRDSVDAAGAGAPQAAIASLLRNVQRHDWDAAYAQVAGSSNVDQASFIRDLSGTHGALRTFSGLTGWDLNPLRATDSDAEVRATMHWATPVGALDDARDLKVVREDNAWKVVWPQPHFPDPPPQVIPLTFMRWDLVTGGSGDEWGNRNVDGPRVRIVSMNAVSYEGGSVVIGEAINEDSIPAFVNVNATLVGPDGQVLGNESSFDKVLHVLLPKQVTPYRIDFPEVELAKIKSVQMDVKTSLIGAAADPVIEVSNQAIGDDGAGAKALQGQLLNQSGQVVNIPHIIATFYDDGGRVIWVADGYIDRALLPQSPEPFRVRVPERIANNARNYRVVVNQYSLGGS